MSYTILKKNGYYIPKIDKYYNTINKIKNELTVEPYQFFNKKKNSIKFTVFQENDDYLIIPKYYGIKTLGTPDKNEENLGEIINIEFKGNLRDNQILIVDSILPHINNYNGGVLCLPCAAGKTVLALYLACHFKVKTLVIVHKTFLLNQWKQRALEFTNASIGIIKQNKIDIKNKDIVIGMLQSIAKDKYDENVFKDFGLVIFDEAHHAPSKYFSKTLPIISSKISIGLSATPKRADKLEKILYWYFGDLMYESKIEENNTVLVNIINYKIEHEKFKEFKLKNGDINRPLTINKITTIGRRNKFIIDNIEDVINESGRKIIVLSDRIEHLKLLKKRLDEREIVTSDFYIGGRKQKDLDHAEQASVIFASYAMASEGLDIPNLNTLFMVTSRKEVEQPVGRITRKINPNCRPIIYDFVDNLNTFINQGRCRKRFYNKMGFEIQIINVENNKIINTIKIENEKKPCILSNIDECQFSD